MERGQARCELGIAERQIEKDRPDDEAEHHQREIFRRAERLVAEAALVAQPAVVDLLVVARTSKASPKLWLACASGQHIKSAILTCRKAGGGQQEFYKITLTDVLVRANEVDGEPVGGEACRSACLIRPDRDELNSKASARLLHFADALQRGIGARSVIEGNVRNDIGGDEQSIESLSTRYYDVTFKHLLLPVYAGAYRFNGKLFQIVVNGRTGEIQGDRPYSFWKIALLVVSLLFVALILVLVFGDQ